MIRSDFKSFLVSLTGEQRLALAILSMSMLDVSAGNGHSKSAREWFVNGDELYPFTFEGCCDCLGFDSHYLRRTRPLWRRALREIVRDEDSVTKARSKAAKVLYLLMHSKRIPVRGRNILMGLSDLRSQRRSGYE